MAVIREDVGLCEKVRGSHCGRAFNPLVYYTVLDRLSQPEKLWCEFACAKLREFSYPGSFAGTRLRSDWMREFKKYPNRRLYDIEESRYVTVEDLRKIIVKGDSISVVDSKTGRDLSRTVLLQIISEQEGEGREPILTNRVLEQLVRYYGDPVQGIVSRYIEQSIMTFLEHQEQYRLRIKEFSGAEPLNVMRKVLGQNIEFWNNLASSTIDRKR